jgi:P27 family predicted phage terminase small subunit
VSRGPAPTPTHLRILKGNPGKRPLNKAEPKPEKGPVDPPDWLVELDVPAVDLEHMTVKALRALVRDLEVAKTARMRKGELIAAVVAASEGDRLRFWRRIQADLVGMGVMTKADGLALALLCDNLGLYLECRRILRDEGLTYDFTTKMGIAMPLPRPEVGIANAALAQAMRFMDRFGLNPAYRSKLKVEAEREADGLDLLRKSGSGNAG